MLCLEGSESPIYSKSPVCSAVEAAAIVILLSSRPSAHDPALSPRRFYLTQPVPLLSHPYGTSAVQSTRFLLVHTTSPHSGAGVNRAPHWGICVKLEGVNPEGRC